MRQSKLGLKVLGLSALVLGLMAISTSMAQAEPNAQWLVNNAAVSTTLLPALAAALESTSTLLTKIIGKKVEINCKKIELVGAHLVEPLGKLLGKAIFSECPALIIDGVKTAACTPKEEKIATTTVVGLIKLHKVGEVTEQVVELTPEVGETFATVILSEACAIGEEIPIKGKVFLRDCLKQFLKDQVVHLVEFGTSTLGEGATELSVLYAISNTAEHKATIHGSANVFLTGSHLNMTWAGHS